MYLNLVQIAESFGVSEKVVEGWVRNEGLPCTPDRSRLLFDRARVTDWAATRGLAARAGFLAAAQTILTNRLRLAPLLHAGGIWRDVPAAEAGNIFERVISALPGVTPPVRQLLGQRLCAPGGVTMAPIGGGFALPHPAARVTLGRDCGAVALILLREAMPPTETRVDDVPITRLLFFIAPSPRAHLDLLGCLSRLVRHGAFRETVKQSAPDTEIFSTVEAADAAPAHLPAPEVNT